VEHLKLSIQGETIPRPEPHLSRLIKGCDCAEAIQFGLEDPVGVIKMAASPMKPSSVAQTLGRPSSPQRNFRSSLDFGKCSYEHKDVAARITPQAIQELIDELEASKQSRLRAWQILQQIRAIVTEEGNTTVPPAAAKTFDSEGEVIAEALKKTLRARNAALHDLIRVGRTYKAAVDKIDGQRPPEFPSAHVHLLKALDRAQELLEE
jgi:hypothetical protein